MGMKREINFRVWDVENSRYLEDEVMWSVAGVPPDMMPGQAPFIPFLMVALKSPETKYIVEQFTGIKDSSGREIYEGDLIEFPQDTPGVNRSKTYVCEVRYSTDDCGGVKAGWLIGGDYSLYENIKVVGNIHQHRHLVH